MILFIVYMFWINWLAKNAEDLLMIIIVHSHYTYISTTQKQIKIRSTQYIYIIKGHETSQLFECSTRCICG